ncbi:MAG: histidine kinase [Bacteroidia bacterium]|nr:histidine kinase [Bacteroidia bacterium]
MLSGVHNVYRCVICAFCICAWLPVTGQSFYFRYYNVNDGMPFAQVNAIHQGMQGYLWTGAYGGLSRFDGRKFVNYSPKNGLITYSVNSITADDADNIWIATIAGVSRFSNNLFKNYTKDQGLPNVYVNVIIKDQKNRIWAGTQGGLAYFDGKRFVTYSDKLLRANARILSLHVNGSGELWVGTGQGVFRINTLTLTTEEMFRMSDGLCDSVITAITSDQTGSIYLGTPNGISILRDGKIQSIPAAPGFPDNSVSSLVYDPRGGVWIGTAEGLCRLEKNIFIPYHIEGPFGANRILSLFTDREGNLWVGTSNGLYKHSGALFSTWSVKDGLSGAYVFPIRRDARGALWIGSDDGLNCLENGKLRVYKKQDGLAGNAVNDLALGTDGKIYAGTNQGLSVYNGTGFRNYFGKKDGLISDSVSAVRFDHLGRLWLGGHCGYTLMENGKFSRYPLPVKKNRFDIWFLFEDSKNRMWIGTFQGGLFMYDGAIHDMAEELSISDESCLAVSEDENGNIWIGSLRGLYMWDGKSIRHIDESKGLNSDLIYVLGADKDPAYLWIGTNQGMNKLNLKKYLEDGKVEITDYGKEDGFIFSETNSNGFWKDEDGSIWYGTVGGVIRYDPKYLPQKELEPITHITSVQLFYKDTALTANSELSYDQNHLAFSFIGIHFANPSKVRYRYRLHGFETDWSPVTAMNAANYSSLPPGEYRFEVMSRNNNGLWNTSPVTYSFTILSPWWKTLWFQTSLILSVLLAGYSAIRFRIRQVRQREQNRTRLAAMELKALRAQMNPHFIFNALNSIQHFIMHSNEEGATKYLNKFARLIRTILNNSERSTVTLEEEVESLRLYLDLEVLRFENKFTWEIVVDPELNLDFYEIPTMLIQPYVENAILHGLVPKPTIGHLRIELRLDEHHIVCVITDDGIGRKASRTLKERSMKQKHQSFGMKITHDRLELLNNVQQSNLSVNITDLENDFGEATGTRVEIFTPIA